MIRLCRYHSASQCVDLLEWQFVPYTNGYPRLVQLFMTKPERYLPPKIFPWHGSAVLAGFACLVQTPDVQACRELYFLLRDTPGKPGGNNESNDRHVVYIYNIFDRQSFTQRTVASTERWCLVKCPRERVAYERMSTHHTRFSVAETNSADARIRPSASVSS